jgi:solute carrier family 25 (mitochondrial folate transporter), member 32
VQDGALRAVRYRSLTHAAVTVAREEGLRGFYRGVTPGALGSGLSWGLYFSLYERAKRRMATTAAAAEPGRAAHAAPLTASQHLYAAWEAGTLTCLLTNPIWLVKTRMQLQGPPAHPTAPAPPTAVAAAGATPPLATPAAHVRPYRNVAHALYCIVREEGVLGLYRGLTPALLLVSHGMIQFGVYEQGKAAISRRNGGGAPPTPSELFAVGAGSKALATLATYPYQVIKSRLQQRVPPAATDGAPPGSLAGQQLPYRSVVDCVRRMAASEGLRGFYKGFSANLLRVAPQSAVTLTAYELLRDWLGDGRGDWLGDGRGGDRGATAVSGAGGGAVAQALTATAVGGAVGMEEAEG